MDPVLSSLPSSSSTPLPLPPSPPPEIKYEVFVSFRGEDTRNNFTSHLHKALHENGIETFIDNKLRRGDEISPSLVQAIEESQIAIIIFSERYASSGWCLEELAKILECKKNHGQIVIPVFYEIDPSDVRNQTGTFAVAFDSHQRRFKENLDKVRKWRCDLKEAANLSGFDSRVVKPESVLVENIVEDVLERLNNMPPSDDNKKLVGIESRIKEIELALGAGDQINKDVCSVGIWGIGGIGKTTLARAVFDNIFYQFEGSHFVDNVREALEKKDLPFLRRELYSAILRDENAYTYTFTKKRLSRKKLLIVFDDVPNFEQVENLIGDLDSVGSESRIIVTTRDQQVLKNLGVEYTFKVEDLCFSDALKLFCRHAFKKNHPKVDYKELSKCVVKMVGGVPLALKVLGSFLLGKRKEVWESSMKKLEKSLDKKIHDVLKISYEGLDHDQQKIFLDIACFYKGWGNDYVIAIMNASGFCAANDISALTDKSLIFISNNYLEMHDLLQVMGKEIVRQESFDDPGRRSRLWDHEEIDDILTNATGTEKVEGIDLDMSKSRDIYLHPCALAKMTKMRYLRFSSYWDSKNKVHILPGLQYVSAKLRYLHWYGCPLKSLESNFYLKKLVDLSIFQSEVEELWRGVQQFDDLKSIELRECNNLISIPDCSGCKSLKFLRVGCSKLKRLSEIPSSLEHLSLNGCESLIELPSSFKHLNKLRHLDVGGCKSLTSIPDLRGCESLEHLCLDDCLKLKMLPELPNSIQYLSLINSLIEELPDSLCCLTSLNHLEISNCERLKVLPKLPWADISAANCTSLEELSCPSFCNDFFAQNSDVDSSIGVDLGNCYKLDQNSVDNFLKDILQNLEGLAASAKTSYHYQDFEEAEPYISICYPKSEIPEWFGYQKDGSFIDLSLPKDLFNYNFLCFAICVVVAFKDQRYDEDEIEVVVNYECKKKSEKGDHKLVGKLSSWVPKPQSQNGRSNHVIFGVDFYVFPKPCDNKFTFQFYGEPNLRPNIEKCGVYLVFGKHLEISNESEDVDKRNLEESDQENEPHPKRLKHF